LIYLIYLFTPGQYYGIQKPDVNDKVVPNSVIEEFQSRPLVKRSDSFVKAFEYSPHNSLEESWESDGSESPSRDGVIQRKPRHLEE
jgi:hypothetical protein